MNAVQASVAMVFTKISQKVEKAYEATLTADDLSESGVGMTAEQKFHAKVLSGSWTMRIMFRLFGEKKFGKSGAGVLLFFYSSRVLPI